jgi:hypothetical protein
VKSSTAASLIAQYVTDPAALVPPRFALFATVLIAGRQSFEALMRLHAATPGTETAVATAEIIESSGIESDSLKNAFAVGKKLNLTYSSAQEFNSTIKFSATDERSLPGFDKVYYDKVFKSFVIIDGGSAVNLGRPVIEGRVTDGAGAAVGDAMVSVWQHGVEHASITDADGNYSIATPQGEPLKQGVWPVHCGGLTRSILVGDAITNADFNGVDAESARRHVLGSCSTDCGRMAG